METAYFYLTLSGVLTVLLWTPYILARVFVWGPLTFLGNYPKNFPAEQPTPPLWAQRAQRAHLNMVETLPAFIAVIVGADYLIGDAAGLMIALWAKIFFFARAAHAVVYILAIPALRTPIYLVSWAAILMIAKTALL
ncbi:MAPEG family protein [Hyphococcus sp.]|uniref:MAPEG family protein n=1 Tax=Hyphococcus sp. TaxID=2038636 RepID=UPI00207ECA04|nr:MAG: membrane protein [Marinicaulis sp.]